MRRAQGSRSTVFLALAILTGVACASGTGGSGAGTTTAAGGESRAAQPGETEHVATLSPLAGSNVTGRVSLRSGASPNETRARITIRGSRLGAEHLWFIRQGQCGENGNILGPQAAYRPLIVRTDGDADVTTTLPVEIPTSGSYYVMVTATRADLERAIACGGISRAP